ncbi:putative c6 zinc finger domain-containing protein [Phaeomoniella chlamydospora]|uniref:Putative c6 zinc finger domain-containing protein n=1 Tax=Phaeomoniella chlamydospora TaxID=158046 RepID=A0A0G2GE72_PHACM|nr:putative c6 zinc finger domain-containing protein [Phaeomoniella chlamydospora]
MSLLFMDTKEAAAADLPRQKTTLLIQNWYDAALFFLHQGDFLRKHDMRSVQVIAILLGLFKNVGDFGLQPTLMAAGIRIAQCLGMDKEPPTVSTDPIDQEVSRRIWWTLIICEWLQRPARPYCIQESDFAVNLPFNLDDEEILDPQLRAHPTGARDRPRPVQYHNAMIALSQLYYRFSSRAKCIGHNSEKLESLVLQTDEALANLIEELPLHLSGDSVPESGLENNSVPPWVLWQRNSLSISILFYRMAINRILQNQWVQLEKSYARTQAVCLSSARAIVSLVERYSAQLARHRPWATSSNLFSAAITLAVEARFSDEHTAAAYSEDINRCIAFFTSIQDQNVLASRAIEVLRQYMTEPPDPW